MPLKALKKNDIVEIVAPGFGCSREDLELGLAYLQRQGFRPRVPQDLFGDCPIHSNTDEKRAQQLIEALTAPDSKAIWFLRGGYGSNKLLSYLRKIRTKPRPKMTIGISDITSLHSFFIQSWGWNTLHGSLLDRLGKGQVPEDVEAELLKVVRGEQKEVVFQDLVPLNEAAHKQKNIQVVLVGGNLKVIESHVGTREALKLDDRMVMFEEIGERGYRVDRMLFHLQEARAFKNCKAVVFGSFTHGDEPEGKASTIPWVLENWAGQQSFPVLKGLPCGHDVVQRVLPLGTRATLKLNPSGTATLTVPTGVKK